MIKDINPPSLESDSLESDNLESARLEPVSLSSAKAFLRVDHEDEDELITDLIQSARERIEVYLSTSLITRRRLISKPNPQNGHLYLNHYPIKRVIAVDYVEADERRRLSPSDYLINLHTRPASLRLLRGYNHAANAIEIEIEAGYGDDASAIPMPLRQAMMLLIAQSYEQRGDGETAMPMMAQALLMPYKGIRL